MLEIPAARAGGTEALVHLLMSEACLPISQRSGQSEINRVGPGASRQEIDSRHSAVSGYHLRQLGTAARLCPAMNDRRISAVAGIHLCLGRVRPLLGCQLRRLGHRAW